MQHLRKRKLPTLSMAPMIDCVFLLLIFLMVSTTFAPIPGLRVQLPPPITPPPSAQQAIVVRIANPAPGETEGTILMSGAGPEAIVGTGEMFNRLLNAPEASKSRLTLMAERDVFHGQIVRVMDIAKRAGIDNIGFAIAR